MDTLSRRDMIKAAGGAGLVAAIPHTAAAQPTSKPSSDAPPPAPAHAPTATQGHNSAVDKSTRLFLNDYEAAFLRAAVDHLIPPDETGPGAAEAGVVDYIDLQLASGYGAGERLYLQGPWKQGTPEQGYQLPYTPADLYRNGITALRQHLEARYAGRPFDQLDRSQQDRMLRDMEAGTLDLGDVPSAVLFETLLANTIEGYFADPVYGGNRDMAAWKMIGFPGAYAHYASLVEYHGMKFDEPPISMAHVHNANHDTVR